jgi:uncharacterized protein (DUF1778 family)
MTRSVTIRFSVDELALIDGAASAFGVTRSEFVRRAALRASGMLVLPVDCDMVHDVSVNADAPPEALLATLKRRPVWAR